VTGRWELNDEQWAVVEPVLRPARRADNRGRPWHETRAVLNGVFRVLGTGAQWCEMPEKYPPYQTCHRRFQQWIRSGMLEEMLKLLARHLHERGQLNLEEASIVLHVESSKFDQFHAVLSWCGTSKARSAPQKRCPAQPELSPENSAR